MHTNAIRIINNAKPAHTNTANAPSKCHPNNSKLSRLPLYKIPSFLLKMGPANTAHNPAPKWTKTKRFFDKNTSWVKDCPQISLLILGKSEKRYLFLFKKLFSNDQQASRFSSA